MLEQLTSVVPLNPLVFSNDEDGFKSLDRKMKSIMKLCGKLARLLVGMARSDDAYNPNKIFMVTA